MCPPGWCRVRGEGRSVVRGMGRIFTNKGSRNLYIAYFHRGVEHRETCGSPRKADAQRLLTERLAAIQTHRFMPDERRLTFEDLVTAYLRDYTLRGFRSVDTAKLRVSHLRGFFGRDRALDITPTRVREYQAWRRDQGASGATVNRETTALGTVPHPGRALHGEPDAIIGGTVPPMTVPDWRSAHEFRGRGALDNRLALSLKLSLS